MGKLNTEMPFQEIQPQINYITCNYFSIAVLQQLRAPRGTDLKVQVQIESYNNATLKRC